MKTSKKELLEAVDNLYNTESIHAGFIKKYEDSRDKLRSYFNQLPPDEMKLSEIAIDIKEEILPLKRDFKEASRYFRVNNTDGNYTKSIFYLDENDIIVNYENTNRLDEEQWYYLYTLIRNKTKIIDDLGEE